MKLFGLKGTYCELHVYSCLSIVWEAGLAVVNLETETHANMCVCTVIYCPSHLNYSKDILVDNVDTYERLITEYVIICIPYNIFLQKQINIENSEFSVITLSQGIKLQM